MSKTTRQTHSKLLVVAAALIGFSSSAVAENISNSTSDSDEVLVFGTFELQKNGYTVKMRDGLFGNSATLHLRHAETWAEETVQVGDEGLFATELAPGEYYITSVEFRLQSQVVKPETDLRLTVKDSHDANYVGTLTMRTRIESGYYGASGEVEQVAIRDNCNEECPDLLERLGAEDASMAVSLPTAGQRVALSQ